MFLSCMVEISSSYFSIIYMWQHWVNGILGLWFIVMALTGMQSITTIVATGTAIAIVGFWGALQKDA